MLKNYCIIYVSKRNIYDIKITINMFLLEIYVSYRNMYFRYFLIFLMISPFYTFILLKSRKTCQYRYVRI